jgi:hypothetical protein
MAITAYKKPQILTPAYNSQVFTALSNQIAIADFKYVVTVTINGVANVKEYLQRPDGWLVVDVKEWVQNFIEHYFNPTLSLASPIEVATNKSVTVLVNIKEFYSGVMHTGVNYTYTAFDASLTESVFRNYNFNDYLFNQTAGKLFLSKTIDTITPDNRLTLGQNFYLHFINNITVPITNISIDLRRGASTIDNVNIAALPTSTAYNTFVMRLNSTMFTVATPQISDIIRISFNGASGLILRYSITLKDLCTNYTDNILYYLDRDGNILFFHFEKVSKNSYTKKTNKVTLSADRLNTTTGEYGANSWDREDHIVSTAIESTILLNTDWITETQSRQLNDLWSSPQVWLHNGTELLPITITNNGYEEYKLENESLFQYNVIVNTGVVETRQRGL